MESSRNCLSCFCPVQEGAYDLAPHLHVSLVNKDQHPRLVLTNAQTSQSTTLLIFYPAKLLLCDICPSSPIFSQRVAPHCPRCSSSSNPLQDWRLVSDIMSDSDSSHAPKKVTLPDSSLETSLRQQVIKAQRAGQDIIVNAIRAASEEALGLQLGFFKNHDTWSSRSKKVIRDQNVSLV